MKPRLNQSWPQLAKTLLHNHWLSPALAREIEQGEPSSSMAWLQQYLAHKPQGLDAHELANRLADYWHIKRAQPHEWGDTPAPIDLQEYAQGLVWMGGEPACIGIVDASDAQLMQRLRFLVHQPFEWRVVSLDEYRSASVVPSRFSQQVSPAPLEAVLSSANELDSQDAPMVRYIQDLLMQMVRERASDVHFEPFADHYRVRARIDGVLHEVASPDLSLKEQLSVRLKVMAHLDIAEKRLPQDGRIKLQLPNQDPMDCRVSTLPTLFGEKIVVRFLNSHARALELSALGYEAEQLTVLENVLTHPHGLVLMTGPTGSGKTVSLYACLARLNRTDVNISTVEDPVEIFMSGVNQVSINEKAGIHFATVLRAFLRQDPDIIMVGEIRDLETADIALKAAQTGHLVFSTLHTNDAPLALTRLSQMGVSDYSIAASVSVVVAQRLVRLLCSCKKPTRLNPHLLQSAGLSLAQAQQSDWQAYEPVGCVACHQTGYLGRIGVFQVLPISPAMQSLIASHAQAQALRAQAASEGVLTLRQAGLRKVLAGLCSLSDIMDATLE
ncbi:MAG: GspE/PulE family protein [Formosimonas sp.]